MSWIWLVKTLDCVFLQKELFVLSESHPCMVGSSDSSDNIIKPICLRMLLPF